jgi:hypothetical protein
MSTVANYCPQLSRAAVRFSKIANSVASFGNSWLFLALPDNAFPRAVVAQLDRATVF